MFVYLPVTYVERRCATLESLDPEDQSLWRMTKPVMRVPTPSPPPTGNTLVLRFHGLGKKAIALIVTSKQTELDVNTEKNKYYYVSRLECRTKSQYKD